LPPPLKLRRAEVRGLVEALAKTGPGDPVRRGSSIQAQTSLEYWITRMRMRG